MALIGISAPIGLSFILQRLVNATPVQAFAAGAALCSTSLGTTFTILSTSGLDKSRLGVILSSAAMLDDVAGLVMVKVISNLGSSASAFSSTTVVRPVFVSIAFAVIIPFTCRLLIQPLTKYLWVRISKAERLERHFASPPVAFVAHTLLLVALITGSTYAGTSNLFAAYIAGAVVTWWDALILSVSQDNVTKDFKNEPAANTSQLQESTVEESSSTSQRTDVAHPTEQAQTLHELSSVPPALQQEGEYNAISGVAIYDKFYAPAVNCILKPFFFVSCAMYNQSRSYLTSLTGINWLRNSHNPDVSRCNFLARNGLHHPHDPRQSSLRSCASALQKSPKLQFSIIFSPQKQERD